MTTVVVAVTTAMQISGPWAALIAFNVGQPGLHVGFPAALLIVAVSGFVQTAIVRIVGMIVDAPWLVLFFFFSVVGTSAALAISSRIPVAWILLNVGINSILYTALFSPYAVGWSSAYIFSGVAMAALFLASFEVVLWPVDEEPELRRSLAECLRGVRARLARIGRAWLVDPGDASDAVPPLVSKLGAHLKLLEGVESKHRDERRTSRLLGAISQVERITFATERLALVAAAPGSRALPPALYEEASAALHAAEEAIESCARRLEAGSEELERDEAIARLRARLSELAASNERARSGGHVGSADASNAEALVAGLGLVCDVADPLPPALPSSPPVAAAPRSLSARLGPGALRYGAKVGLASAIGLLIGLYAHRANLSVILWTVLIASLPGYGATVRKVGLRLFGALAGGLITLIVLMVVSTSYDSLLAYLVVVFGVAWIGTYVGQSSERLSYAGIQFTNTFLILYVALEPKSSEYDPLWRFWGVVLGTLSVAFVELVVWPERTGPRLRTAFGRAIRIASTIVPGAQPAAAPQLRRAEIDFLVELRHAAGLADEARLEGAKTGVDAAQAVDSLEILRRIVYRLIELGLAPRAAPSPQADDLRAQVSAAIRGRLVALAERIDPSMLAPSAIRDDELETSVHRLTERGIAGSERSEAGSYGRVVELLHDLERSLAPLATT
jgi:uncharacterized membrane protein YccC